MVATSDMSIWTDTTDHFKLISVLSLSDIMDTRVESRIRMQGFLCALHIYALGQSPYPCSPFLLLYSIGASELLFDLDLIKSLAPEIGGQLAAVDDGHGKLISDTSSRILTGLLGSYLYIQVCLSGITIFFII